MRWFRKLVGRSSSEGELHPLLPPDADRFLPRGGQGFRASVNLSGENPLDGSVIFRAGSGSSLVSLDEARQKASEAAQRNLAAALGNGTSPRDIYAYAVHRQLEPVVDTLALPGGPAAARITVNSYGAMVVNAVSALFVDVDTRIRDEAAEDQGLNELAAAKLRTALAGDPELSFRVYRTRNGWRYLCTNRLYDPGADETRLLLEALGADAKYVLLCRAQRCFRARLTPKPWRIGDRFFALPAQQNVTRKQLERYLRKAASFASARFTADVGRSNITHPEVRLILDYHDNWCAAHSDRPLA